MFVDFDEYGWFPSALPSEAGRGDGDGDNDDDDEAINSS